jgi:small acid-soluble spore protein D (minor alpha/beta-type SASP)
LSNEKEKRVMSAKNNNKINVPEARAAMDQFKMEAASEVDVPPPS